MKSKKNFNNIIVLCIFAVAIVGYYYYISNRSNANEKTAKTTKIEETLAKDVTAVTNTPRSTVKFYSTILECLYNESPKDEEVTALGEKARELLDKELIANNPEASYLDDLRAQTNEYSEAKRIVMGFTIESGDDVEYYTEENVEYAIVNSSYTLRETETFTKTNEEYILRKDETDCWRILGWRVATEAVTDDGNDNE